MKKLLAVLLSFIMILSVTACSDSSNSDDETNTDNVSSETQDEDSASTGEVSGSGINPITIYEAFTESGDATISSFFYVSNLTAEGAISELDSTFKCDVAVDGNTYTLTISDDLASEIHTYVFEKSGDTMIFKADSSDTLYFHGNSWDLETADLKEEVSDGTVFNVGESPVYKTASYTDEYVTISIDVDAMTISYSDENGVSFESAFSFTPTGGIEIKTDEYYMYGSITSDTSFMYDLRNASDISRLSSGFVTLEE